MAEISDLNITDSNNTARFPDGMNVSAFNNGARALEGLIARWFRDISHVGSSAGTATAYTFVPNRSVTSLSSGLVVNFIAHLANTGSATLQLQGLTAKPLVRANGSALVVGDILQHQPISAIYVAATDKFHCMGITA